MSTGGRLAEVSSHIVEFNNHIQSYFISSTYGNETLVNRCLEKLASDGDCGTFDVGAYECNVFLVNLHKLLGHSMKKTQVLWSVVAVLEVAVNDEQTRLALVNKFRFLPVLSLLLLELHTVDQQKRVLSLLHYLTYGATIDGQEIYVEKLIKKLLSLIEQNHQAKDRCELVQLALSILVNLCHRDLSTTFVLTRNTNVSQLCNQIKQFGLLACRMYIVLEQNDYIKEMDLHYLLRMSFEEVRLLLASKNSFSLRHVVDFLRYVKTLNDMRESEPVKAALTDEYFSRDVKEFLQSIETYWDDHSRQDEKRDGSKKAKLKTDSRKDSTTDGLFDILECIVSLKPDDGGLYRKICEIGPIRLINNAQEDCSKAVDLLRTILEKHPKDTDFAAGCKAVLGPLMEMILNNDDLPLMAAFARLLAAIGRSLNATDETMDQIAEQFYQHVFGQMLNQSRDACSFDYSLGKGPTRMYLWSLHAFNELGHLSPTLWYAKVANLLKQKPIQFLIAKGLTDGGDVELLEAMLLIATSSDFPKRKVALMIELVKNNVTTNMSINGSSLMTAQDRLQPMGAPTGYSFIRVMGRDLQERMDQTVMQMQDAKAAGLINDVEKSELVEFYTYKINMQTNLMMDLRNSLESTSSQITTLMHQNQLLMAEIEKSQKKSLPLLLKESALENENRLLERELVQMKAAAASYDKKMSHMKQEMSEYVKKYGEKSQKCAALVKEIEHLRTRDNNYEKENKRLLQELAMMTKNRDDARKLLKVGEEDRQKLTEQRDAERKQFECKVREREREISKRNDLVQQLEATLVQRDSSIESLEKISNELRAKVKEREDRIVQVESELKESEKIQQAIYSLMNKSKK